MKIGEKGYEMRWEGRERKWKKGRKEVENRWNGGRNRRIRISD